MQAFGPGHQVGGPVDQHVGLLLLGAAQGGQAAHGPLAAGPEPGCSWHQAGGRPQGRLPDVGARLIAAAEEGRRRRGTAPEGLDHGAGRGHPGRVGGRPDQEEVVVHEGMAAGPVPLGQEGLLQGRGMAEHQVGPPLAGDLQGLAAAGGNVADRDAGVVEEGLLQGGHQPRLHGRDGRGQQHRVGDAGRRWRPLPRWQDLRSPGVDLGAQRPVLRQQVAPGLGQFGATAGGAADAPGEQRGGQVLLGPLDQSPGVPVRHLQLGGSAIDRPAVFHRLQQTAEPVPGQGALQFQKHRIADLAHRSSSTHLGAPRRFQCSGAGYRRSTQPVRAVLRR